jgi:hypothetical protein
MPVSCLYGLQDDRTGGGGRVVCNDEWAENER